MPKYMLTVSYSREGIQGILKDGGTARRDAVAATIKSIGGSLEAMYFAFGADDAIVIIDAPDNVAVAAGVLTAVASGAGSIKTTTLLTPEDMDAVAKVKVSYTPPGK